MSRAEHIDYKKNSVFYVNINLDHALGEFIIKKSRGNVRWSRSVLILYDMFMTYLLHILVPICLA